MKKKLTFLLTPLMCMLGNSVNAVAQDIPEPTAQWNFSNADDLMTPNNGSLKMMPAVLGSKSITFCDLEEAQISSVDGPTDDNKAILVPATSALKVERAEGAEATTSYTLMLDMKVLDANSYDGLFQTNRSNDNDGDLFIHNHQIGMGAMGGYFGTIKDDTWYRIVLTNSDGKVKVYVNGEKVITCDSEGRWEIDPWGFYVFCDEDGEKVDTYVSGVAFWETPLTDEQVNALGSIDVPKVKPFEIGTPQELTEFANLVNSGEADINAILTADIDMGGAEWDLPISCAGEFGLYYYLGTFDGQGHTISNLTIDGKKHGVSCGGLFGLGHTNAVLRNLIVKDCYFTAPYSSGCIAGEWYGVMENCASINVTIEGSNPHGLIGYGGTLKNSYTTYHDVCTSGATTVVNCYSSQNLDKADYASGRLCYLLNQGQESPIWFQNIGSDEYPVPQSSHSVVYASALKCDGSLADNAFFTNDLSQCSERPAHEFNGPCCVNCGEVNPDYSCQEEDGYYLIGSWDDLYWFSLKVNSGNSSINARLTADIDNFTLKMMMQSFNGKFDGNGHTISLNIENPGNFSGIFRNVEADAEVCNLVVDGSMTIGGQYSGGVACYISGVVRNCSSYVTFNMKNGCVGGIAFLLWSSGRVENCFAAPTYVGENLSECSELVGWGDGGTIQNCLVVSEEEANAGIDAIFLRGPGNVINCYYKYAHGNTNGATQVTDEQLASGEVCWLLNKQDFTNSSWYQTIDSDERPVLDPTHNIVLNLDGEYVSFAKSDYDTYMKMLAESAKEEANIISEDGLANKSVIDAYMECIEAFAMAESWEDAVLCYQQMADKKKDVQANMNAYQTYAARAESAKENLSDDKTGTFANLLRSYLKDFVEPNEIFPNGSYLYIMENKPLDTEGVFSETDFLKALQEKVMASEASAGTDISILLNNADFRADQLGWDGGMPVGYVPSLPVVECYQNTGELYQTITGLKNGLYEFTLNAWFRPGGNNDSRMYSTYIFANDQVVPVMSIQEDPIAIKDAVDMQNSYIAEPGTYPYDLIYNENYYIPNSFTGAAYAFIGGRYLNRILVNVTDGSLKVGIRTLGTEKSGDCTEFSNAKLYYLGDFSEADNGLTEVLAGQIARAKVLNEAEIDGDFVQPNFSSALREKLSTLIQTAESAENAEDKYKAIEALSPVFAEVLDGQKAYIHMMTVVEDALNTLFNDMYGELDMSSMGEILNEMSDKYFAGTYTTEEAWNYTSPVQHNMTVEDGYYLITNADDLAWFARLVEANNSDINGKLTNDIDMNGAVWKCPISFYSEFYGGRNYYGIFDGQGHTISNLTIEGKDNVSCGGLFGLGQAGAVLKNLIVKDCHFTAPYSIGCIAGEWYGVMENCASINVTIEGGNPHGLIGYGGALENCYTTYRDLCTAGSTTYANSYAANNLDEADYASGKLCYLLNGDQSNIVWYQSIGEDAYPVLDASHGQVVKNEDGTYSTITGFGTVQADVKGSGVIYNLKGQRVEKAVKGLYIIDGKKVLVK